MSAAKSTIFGSFPPLEFLKVAILFMLTLSLVNDNILSRFIWAKLIYFYLILKLIISFFPDCFENRPLHKI